MTEPGPRICVLTGAGASQPLGLPTMATLLPGDFERHLEGGRDVFDMVTNWAASGRTDTVLDFELLFTGIDHIAPLDGGDPLAMAFAAARGDHVGRFQFKQAAGSYIEANLQGYQKEAAALIERLKGVVHQRLSPIDTAKAAKLYHAFFELLPSAPTSIREIDVFTTNYDRAVEAAYEHEGEGPERFELVRGFQRRGRARAPRFDPRIYEAPLSEGLNVRLYKLHGSLDWRREGAAVVEVGADEYVGRNAVIYPLRKPSLDEPFATLFKLFRMRLKDAHVCVVIGSSLRDEHIRRALVERVQAEALRVVLVDPRASDLRSGLEAEVGRGQTARFVQALDMGFGGSAEEQRQLKGKIKLAVEQATSASDSEEFDAVDPHDKPASEE